MWQRLLGEGLLEVWEVWERHRTGFDVWERRLVEWLSGKYLECRTISGCILFSIMVLERLGEI